jgi:hypothetical protein
MLIKALSFSTLVMLVASLAPPSACAPPARRKAMGKSPMIAVENLTPPFATFGGPPSSPASGNFRWESKARLRSRWGSKPGTLVLSEQGVEFRPVKGSPLRWPYVEIRMVALSTSRQLKLTSYENKGWHRPGDREFRIKMGDPMPPTVAREFISRTAKPAINGIPDPSASNFASILARHPTRGGGTSGVLRFREEGIDYVASGERDSRSWRWSDIQTLAHPDPYHFRVGAYLETFDLELKQPMTRELFDRLWDLVYERDLMVTPEKGAKVYEMDEKE